MVITATVLLDDELCAGECESAGVAGGRNTSHRGAASDGAVALTELCHALHFWTCRVQSNNSI